MYSKHPHIPLDENPDTRIWRFMTLEKFLFLLEKSALFFSRADLLGDPFEGSVPIGNRLQRLLTGNTNWIREAPQLTADGLRLVYVNSWHMNPNEPATMWGTYIQGRTGIAVQSTVSRLQRSFDNAAEEVFIGKVVYGDYDVGDFSFPEGNALFPLLHKRLNYADERELRALYIIDPTKYPIRHTAPDENGPGKFITPPGIPISVSLDTLIETIHVSPSTEEWVRQVLEPLIHRYGITASVLLSDLVAKKPAF